MKLLITSDIHLNDSQKDSVRFELFPWLAKQQSTHKTDASFILGDLTVEKDNHSSVLVNQLIEGLMILKPPVYILKGNHDYIREDLPFFNFLSAIDGITFCTEPEFLKKYNVYMVPHQLTQAALDKALKATPEGCLVFMHQTLTGAISDTGSRLTGMALTPNKAHTLCSGDIHVPHKCEGVTYIGSPYHTRHGIDYIPRVLLLDGDKEIDLYFPAPKKLSLTIRDISELPKLEKGDQLKLTLELPRSEAVEWANHKKAILEHCKQNEVEVYGLELKVAQARKRPRLDSQSGNKSNTDYFQAFCASEKVPAQMKAAGLEFIGT